MSNIFVLIHPDNFSKLIDLANELNVDLTHLISHHKLKFPIFIPPLSGAISWGDDIDQAYDLTPALDMICAISWCMNTHAKLREILRITCSSAKEAADIISTETISGYPSLVGELRLAGTSIYQHLPQLGEASVGEWVLAAGMKNFGSLKKAAWLLQAALEIGNTTLTPDEIDENLTSYPCLYHTSMWCYSTLTAIMQDKLTAPTNIDKIDEDGWYLRFKEPSSADIKTINMVNFQDVINKLLTSYSNVVVGVNTIDQLKRLKDLYGIMLISENDEVLNYKDQEDTLKKVYSLYNPLETTINPKMLLDVTNSLKITKYATALDMLTINLQLPISYQLYAPPPGMSTIFEVALNQLLGLQVMAKAIEDKVVVVKKQTHGAEVAKKFDGSLTLLTKKQALILNQLYDVELPLTLEDDVELELAISILTKVLS